MFEVEYKGANAVIFTTKNTKVMVDAALSVVGVKDLSTAGAVEVATEPRFVTKAGDSLVCFEGPGEYEVADISLVGIPARRHLDADGQATTIYRMTIGELRIALLGNIAPQLTESQLESIGVVDIAVVPVGGGGYTLDATAAARVVRQLDPRVAIPIHYADAGLQYEVPQDGVDAFIAELGAAIIEAGAKWKVKGVSALPEQLTVVKIERSA